MKKLFKTSIIVLLIIFSSYKVTWSADSYSFSVSCSIPAVPGLNVPLSEEQNLTTVQETTPQPQAQDLEKSVKEEATHIIQTEKKMVKTVYSR